jgi:outer membrane protein assembly factor BamB
MTVDQLIFVGLRGYVLALDRDSGQIVWSNDKLKSGFTTLLLDGDRLIVATNGYMHCLDPLTGKILWQNPLKGYGIGVTDLASVRGRGPRAVLPHAAAVANEQASTSASATASSAGTM